MLIRKLPSPAARRSVVPASPTTLSQAVAVAPNGASPVATSCRGTGGPDGIGASGPPDGGGGSRDSSEQDTSATKPAHMMIRLKPRLLPLKNRSEEHTSELQSIMRISYDVLWLKQKQN